MRFNIMHMSIQSCGESGTPDFCSCDYLEIRDGSSSSDRLLATFCGTKKNLPEPIYSSGRHLWVRFKSDGEVVSSGFVASFSSETIRKGEWKGVLVKCLSKTCKQLPRNGNAGVVLYLFYSFVRLIYGNEPVWRPWALFYFGYVAQGKVEKGG